MKIKWIDKKTREHGYIKEISGGSIIKTYDVKEAKTFRMEVVPRVIKSLDDTHKDLIFEGYRPPLYVKKKAKLIDTRKPKITMQGKVVRKNEL